MEYNKLISITGFSGLFELLSSKTDGAIVKSLDDQSTKFVSSRIHQFSHLESIEVYTTEDNVNLVDVFQAIKTAAKALPAEKDDKAIKAYFKEVFPTMDFERVYTSDMKKMIKWYNVIDKNGIEVKLSNTEE
jgi:5'(3')-deoxyribonucleotidase